MRIYCDVGLCLRQGSKLTHATSLLPSLLPALLFTVSMTAERRAKVWARSRPFLRGLASVRRSICRVVAFQESSLSLLIKGDNSSTPRLFCWDPNANAIPQTNHYWFPFIDKCFSQSLGRGSPDRRLACIVQKRGGCPKSNPPPPPLRGVQKPFRS